MVRVAFLALLFAVSLLVGGASGDARAAEGKPAAPAGTRIPLSGPSAGPPAGPDPDCRDARCSDVGIEEEFMRNLQRWLRERGVVPGLEPCAPGDPTCAGDVDPVRTDWIDPPPIKIGAPILPDRTCLTAICMADHPVNAEAKVAYMLRPVWSKFTPKPECPPDAVCVRTDVARTICPTDDCNPTPEEIAEMEAKAAAAGKKAEDAAEKARKEQERLRKLEEERERREAAEARREHEAGDRVRAAQAATVDPGATAEQRRAAGERLHEETLAHNDLRAEHARAREARRAEIEAQRRRADAATDEFVDAAQERYFMEERAHYAAYRSEREREVRRAHGKPPGGSKPGDGGRNDPPERTLFNVCGGNVRECFTPAHVIDNSGLPPFER